MIIVSAVLCWFLRFIRKVTITLEGRNLSIKLLVSDSVYTRIVESVMNPVIFLL